MQDSLGGTANTALIICCSPSSDNAAETLSSLRFGVRARGIVNSLVVNAANIVSSAAADGTAKELEVECTPNQQAYIAQMTCFVVMGVYQVAWGPCYNIRHACQSHT